MKQNTVFTGQNDNEAVTVDYSAHKKILITGAHSYIGEAFERYAHEHYAANFEIDTVDMIDGKWQKTDFSSYDAVFHVAGIAHADVGKVSAETKKKYYAVNRDLAIETAKKAKDNGVKQFVFMSSMIVYGESAGYGQKRMITKDTVPTPANFYGDSKWQADKGVRALANESFNVAVLRPPMIYGKGSKGNYPTLAKLAKKLPLFPKVKNERSMLHIDNLCEFLCQIMLTGKGGVFFPQNKEYTNTCEMVKEIAEVSGKKIRCTSVLNPFVFIGSKMPGKIGGLVNKAFGNMTYEHGMSEYSGIDYQSVSLKESIVKTEEKLKKNPKALILASVASMIDQFNMQNIQLLLDNGYQVEVACNCKVGNTISNERIQNLINRLAEKNVSVIHVPIPRKITDIKGIKNSLAQVKRMCNENQYDLLHCHSPIGSVVARLAAIKARKHGTKVIYTAHGFHFYKGAPKQNWLIFYPIEWLCSVWTDVLITINKEDYVFAKKHMKAGRVEYIPGVGVDTKKFRLNNFDKVKKKTELGLCSDDVMILSVGELNRNKNHEVIVKAIAKLDKSHIHYFIAGQGDRAQYLTELANKLGVNLHLLGYRTDIVELLNAADIFAFPSFREGLSVALMEAMAAGLPCVVSEIRGNVDLIDRDGGFLCRADDVDGFSDGIKNLIENKGIEGKHNRKIMEKFDAKRVMESINKIYFATLYNED
jgi:glycosyltransferase involved in cell wall biosynthesis/nucleoside-diphosphate-sugar epimerase